ncbi:MAG: hypothetical protein NW200_03595 [Hyphomonadaceae bacterium]|nr:hypothetical protein [Hyphomonadaceae bacterium]
MSTMDDPRRFQRARDDGRSSPPRRTVPLSAVALGLALAAATLLTAAALVASVF